MILLRTFATAVFAFAFALTSGFAFAQTGGSVAGSVAGNVVDASSRGGIPSARVQLLQGETVLKTTLTDDKGAFAFDGLAAGTYAVRTSAGVYATSTSAPFGVVPGTRVSLSVDLQRVSATTLRTIGSVTVNGQSAVSTSSVSSATITANDYVNRGINQIQTGIDQLPGITIEHYDNGAPGAVATLSIRGAGGFVGGSNTGYEVLVLQDGEPVRNGQYGDFDLSSLTPSIYQRTELLRGVGGTSIFGANAIGGTLNLVTREPLKTPGADVAFGYGTYGLGEYNLLATDTIGKLGFVLDAHQYGTYGAIPADFRADFGGASCGTTSGICAIATPTQVFNVKAALGKLRYEFSPATSLTLTSTLESDYRDQLGLTLNPTTGGNNNASTDALGVPYFYGFPGDYVWNIQPKYAADFHTQVLGGDFELRSYVQTLERVVDGNGEPALICCFLSRSVDKLAGDELLYNRVFGNHSLTVGFGGNGDNFFSGSSNASTSISFTGLPITASGSQIERTYLLRDDFQATPKLSLSGAAYYSNYDTLNVRRFDPRFGAVYRPDSASAVRFSLASGFAAPRISDISQILDLSSSDNSSSAQCPHSERYCVANVGNRELKGESATGYDLGFERVFSGRGRFAADVYRTNVYGHLFTGQVPAPPGLVFTGNPNYGGGSPVLFLNKPFNLAGTVYEGLEFSGRVPVPGLAALAVDGYYNTQAAFPTGVDAITETALQNVVNNRQYQGIPLHKLGYGLDYERPDGRASAFFSGTFNATNNAYNLQSFWVWNAGFTLPLGQHLLHVTDTNVFNKNAFLFSNYQGGVPYSGLTGPYLTNALPIQPHTIEVTVESRIGSYR